MSNIAKNIERLMLEQNLKQDDLARLAGVSQNTISKIVKGSTKESRKLPDIARALSVSVNDLVGSGGNPLPKVQTDKKSLMEIQDMLPLLTADEAEMLNELVKNIIDRRRLVKKLSS